MYMIDARLELSPDESELFQKLNLHDIIVYDGVHRTAWEDSAQAHFEKAEEADAHTSWFETDLSKIAETFGTTLWHGLAGSAHSVVSRFHLRITLASLIDGHHIESEDLNQILTAEKDIILASEYLASHFAISLTFDGREDLREL